MADSKIICHRLLSYIRVGNLKGATQLINTYELSHVKEWADGYRLLCESLKRNYSEIAELLLEKGCAVNGDPKLSDGETPLDYAISRGYKKIVEMILSRGDYVNITNKCNRPPLVSAFYKNSSELMKIFLKHGADPNISIIDDKNKKTLIYKAVLKRCTHTVELLLQYGADINYVDHSALNKGPYYAPLHAAVVNLDERMVVFLLSKGAQVDVTTLNGMTPLHVAARYYKRATGRGRMSHEISWNSRINIGIAKELLDRGADINGLTEEARRTPLYYASKDGYTEMIKFLLENGADINISTTFDFTPLLIATKIGFEKIVKLLLEYFPDKNDKNNARSLIEALISGLNKPNESNKNDENSLTAWTNELYEPRLKINFKEIVNALSEYGFSVNPEDVYTSTIFENAHRKKVMLFHGAIKCECLKIVEKLWYEFWENKDINSILWKDFTPLHTAAENEGVKVVEFLIAKGANVYAKTKAGKTPINYAIENRSVNVLQFLLNKRAFNPKDPVLLISAVVTGCKQSVKLLLQHGVNVNSRAVGGQTALHFCGLYIRNPTRIVNQYYIDEKYHKYHTDKNDKIWREVAKILLTNGAHINATDKNGLTALHYASKGGFYEVFELLLEYNADINMESYRGFTAAEEAARKNPTPVPFNNLLIPPWRIPNYNNRNPPRIEKILDIFFDKILKMKLSNSFVSEKNLKVASSYLQLEIGFNDWFQKKIALLQSEKVENSKISLYDIAKVDVHTLSKLLRNENIVAYPDIKYKLAFNFATFADLIETNFKKGLERNELLDHGFEFFRRVTGNLPQLMNGLPIVDIDEILRYLANEDLKTLKEVFTDTSIV